MADDQEKQKNQTDGAADGAEDEDGESLADKKTGNKVLVIVVASGVVLGLLIGALVFLFLGGSKEPDPEVVTQNTVAELSQVAFVPVPTITVNLLQENGLGRKVSLKVILELVSEGDVAAVEKVMPRIRDDFQTFVRLLRLEDIQGSAGILRLKEGLLLRARQSAAPVHISNVLFKEIQVK